MRTNFERLFLAAAILIVPCQAQQAAPKQAVSKYGVEVRTGPMDSILLRDWAPESSLVVAQTRVAKARFPVIDVHSHSSMNGVRTAEDVSAWLRVMDAVGVQTSVVFTDATGAEFDRQAKLFLAYPDRFQVYCGLDTSNPAAPDYADRAVRELERCYRNGARGVGELSDKGWGIGGSERRPLPRAQRLHIDDPRLQKFWKKCAELKLPVNVHVADHPSCWKPLGPKQERGPDFQHFNLSSKDVPSYEELLEKRDRMLAANPGTTFILCHLSNQGNDLAAAGALLARFPNAYFDISARDYELGRQPRAAARFLASHSDRILFGTDMGREQHMYEGWWRLLETADEYIPGRVWWPYYGLDLPPGVLESVYRGNALRILNWTAAKQ